MNGSAQLEHSTRSTCEEAYFPVRYWADRWGFSIKTVRDWFRDEHGPGILRLANTGRRLRRDYTTITVSATAAEPVYAKRTSRESIHWLLDDRGNVNT
jgi:hypothetical protein